MKRIRLKIAAALVLVPGVLGIGNAVGAITIHAPPAATPSGSMAVPGWATYYGWYDNTPPGCATAYSGCAGGTGTYAHPITFASYKGEFPVGTILYYPTVEKYSGWETPAKNVAWTG